jgi:uncharacterized protein (DUF58 family)
LSRPILLACLICLLLLAGLATLRGELLAFAIPLLIYLLYALVQFPQRIDLDIQRALSAERVHAETPVTVTLTITNRGAVLDNLLVEDRVSSGLKIISGSARHLVTLRKNGSFTFSYTISGSRGGYSFESVYTEACDPVGVFQRAQTFPAAGQLFVFPEVTRLKFVAIRPRRTRIYAGSIPARASGAGVEFYGVRDYQAGDPPRAINWHASARHLGSLFSNEFQQERVADVGIVLDGRERTNLFRGGHSLFEYSVLAAASLSDAFLNQGNRVGLLVYGSYLAWSLPGYGKLQREQILHALARAQVGASSVFTGLEHLSPRMFPVESQVVLISPLVGEDLNVLVQLRARGYQVLALSPDPVAYESRILGLTPEVGLAARVTRMERDLLFRRLQRAGIRVIEWDVARPFDQVVRPALRRAPIPQHMGRIV